MYSFWYFIKKKKKKCQALPSFIFCESKLMLYFQKLNAVPSSLISSILKA